MVWVDSTPVGLIIIPQNSREDIHLTLLYRNGSSFVDLRMYAFNQEGSKVPTENGIPINVKLWPQFRSAAFGLEASGDVLSVRDQKMTYSYGLGRPIFPNSVALQHYHQEQIYFEQKDFRSIPFITFKTLTSYKRGRLQPNQRLIAIGPILWSPLIKALTLMEEFLIRFSFLSEEGIEKGGTHVRQYHRLILVFWVLTKAFR